MFTVFVALSTVLFGQAAIDSSFVQTIGNFVTTLFGESAGESVMALIFKIIGFLTSLDLIIMALLAFLPNSSPVRSIFERISEWVRKVVGGNKVKGE